MPPTTTTSTPALPDEILEEIFLRLPPNEPACLLRASLASKLWLSLLSSPTFHGRYREFHGAPPMLGFAYSLDEYRRSGPVFVSSSKFGAHLPSDKKFEVCDCRHGLVLLGDKDGMTPNTLLVCDPMTGYWRELYMPKDRGYDGHVAAVLCAATGCDHRACKEGPFRVVFVSLYMNNDGTVVHARVHCLQMDEWIEPCSNLDEWSEPCSPLLLPEDAFIETMPPVLVQDALHFVLTYGYGDDDHIGILKYDLGSECLALIDAPLAEAGIDCEVILLLSMEDDSLGFALVDGLTLNLWSRHVGSEAVTAWTHRRVINLNNILPIHYRNYRLEIIGSVEGCDIIFMTTNLGIYEINLKSLHWKKIWKRENCRALFPYMRFYSRPEYNTKRNKTEDCLGVEQSSLTIADSHQSEINRTKPEAIQPQSNRNHPATELVNRNNLEMGDCAVGTSKPRGRAAC